jgi:hypothetical protein
MRIPRITAIFAALFLAFGAMSSASAQPASGNLSIEDMPGTWVGTNIGFAGKSPITNQFLFRVTATNGQVATGVQRWRTCQGRQQACAQRSTAGGGWSPGQRMSLALLTDGQIAGADIDGAFTGYVQGDGSMELVYTEKLRPEKDRNPVVSLMRLVRVG